jgi:fructokinase
MRIGVDLGGTKIEAIVLSDSGDILARERVATPDGHAPNGYHDMLDAMAGLITTVETAAGARGARVGVGMPGSISPKTGLVRNANSQWLNGKDILGDLTRVLARPVRVANDANCFALSEAADGAGAGARVVFGVILGTGCGGGVVVDGRVIEGASGVGGEWGHNPLPWMRPDEYPGERCWCGKLGCLEMWISGTGFERDYKRISGTERDGRDIASRIAGKQGGSYLAFQNLADRLARALAVVINILDPDVIVLGGGLSNIPELYPETERLLPDYIFSDVLKNKLVKNKHGDSSGVRGAAWLWGVGE